MILVNLVDKEDNIIGTKEKLQAHKDGDLHRAFSIFIFNSQGKFLLQKRAINKYHSGGLWTNTTCSHQRVDNSDTAQGAKERLLDEMGFETDLEFLYKFIYKVKFKNDLWEHEYDHVYSGTFDGNPEINPEEAEDFKWETPEKILSDIDKNPGKYTFWFRLSFARVLLKLKDKSNLKK